MTDPEGVRANATQKSRPVQLLHDRLAGLLASHALEGTTSGVYRPVGVHDVDGFQAEPAAYLEVVGVVRRGDLEDTCTEFGIYVLVGEDLYLPLDKRHHDPASDKVTVPRILGVDDERHVAEHRFRTRGEDLGVVFSVGTRAFAVQEGVADAVGTAFHFLVVDLEVRDGRTVVRAPVGDTVAAVDQTFLVQADKRGEDRVHVIIVHGVAEATPVEKGAEPLVLSEYLLARLQGELAATLHESLASEVPPRLAFFAYELALDDVLDCYRGVVDAWKPQCLVALHPGAPDESVLYGAVQRVAHVQGARDVRRRYDYAIGLVVGVRVRFENATALPLCIPAALDGAVVVGFWYLCSTQGVFRRSLLRRRSTSESRLPVTAEHRP